MSSDLHTHICTHPLRPLPSVTQSQDMAHLLGSAPPYRSSLLFSVAVPEVHEEVEGSGSKGLRLARMQKSLPPRLAARTWVPQILCDFCHFEQGCVRLSPVHSGHPGAFGHSTVMPSLLCKLLYCWREERVFWRLQVCLPLTYPVPALNSTAMSLYICEFLSWNNLKLPGVGPLTSGVSDGPVRPQSLT